MVLSLLSMDRELEKKIQDRFRTLPPTVQTALVSGGARQSAKTIAAQHNLSSEQSAALETEVMLVLLNFTLLNELGKNIQNAVKLDAPAAIRIAEKVDHALSALLKEEDAKTSQKETGETEKEDAAREHAQAPPRAESSEVAEERKPKPPMSSDPYRESIT